MQHSCDAEPYTKAGLLFFCMLCQLSLVNGTAQFADLFTLALPGLLAGLPRARGWTCGPSHWSPVQQGPKAGLGCPDPRAPSAGPCRHFQAAGWHHHGLPQGSRAGREGMTCHLSTCVCWRSCMRAQAMLWACSAFGWWNSSSMACIYLLGLEICLSGC